MSGEIFGGIGLAVFLALMFLGVPIAFTFALVGGIGIITLVSCQAGMSNFAVIPFSWATTYSFSCLPMFVLMGFVIAESGITSDLYSAAYKWIGRLPGGLAIASLIACALFSAISGTAIAAAATIGTICYPEMRKFGYDPTLASGAIATGATMDIMIPPSIPMILYSMISEVSVGEMFIAGFGPGLLQVILFSLFIFIMVKRNPSLAPLSAERYRFPSGLWRLIWRYLHTHGGRGFWRSFLNCCLLGHAAIDLAGTKRRSGSISPSNGHHFHDDHRSYAFQFIYGLEWAFDIAQ